MTQCTQSSFEFEAHFSRAVVADFDGGAITTDAGALLLREADRPHRPAAAPGGLLHRLPPPGLTSATAWSRWCRSGSTGWRWATRTSTITTNCAMIRCWRCWPASAEPAASRWPARARSAGWSGRRHGAAQTATRRSATTATAIDRLLVDLFLESHAQAAGADRPRPRRHRHAAARPAGGPLLPRLLRPLLLSAAVHLLRRAAAVRAAARRRIRMPARAAWRRCSASWPRSAQRWPEVQIILRADSGFCRERADELVRGQRRRTTSSAWRATSACAGSSARPMRQAAARASGRASRRECSPSFATARTRRWSRRAARGRQGRADRRQGESALRGDLAERPSSGRRGSLYEELYCARGEMENRIKEQM